MLRQNEAGSLPQKQKVIRNMDEQEPQPQTINHRPIFGTKICPNPDGNEKCLKTIQFHNDVAFQNSLKRGKTLCRHCSGIRSKDIRRKKQSAV